eukprot:jgi/Tetstr1/440851/TSEL_003091.t1
MESHILFLVAKFDFCADDIEEWVHTLRELREKQWEESQAGPAAHNARNAAELPHNAEAAVGRVIEDREGLKRLEWNPVTTIGLGKTNDDSIKHFFDAGQGNLVIMDMSEHHENIIEAERIDLLGDWEATRSVGKIRSHKDLKDPDEKGRPVPDTSWETFGCSEKVLQQWELWNDLLIVMQFLGQERVDGVYLPRDNLDHVRLRLEYIELKTSLTAFQNNDPMKIEAARKMHLAQAYLSKGRKRAHELAEMDIDPNVQVAQLHCADMFDLHYHHHWVASSFGNGMADESAPFDETPSTLSSRYQAQDAEEISCE